MKTHLENTNKRLDGISQKVLEITKILEFTHGQLDEERTKIKNDIGKLQAVIKELDEDLLDAEPKNW